MFNAATTGSITTIFGDTISAAISTADPLTPTLHNWSASTTTGLFSTSSDLATEWRGYLATMQKGGALTDVQRLEANAEAVFENTGLAKLSAADQARDRQDLQREFDAISAAMTIAGVDPSAPITTQTYLTISNTIQGNAALEELAMQGHGLNWSNLPPLRRLHQRLPVGRRRQDPLRRRRTGQQRERAVLVHGRRDPLAFAVPDGSGERHARAAQPERRHGGHPRRRGRRP